MKILVVSHNVFSKTGNMGKTLLSYFRDFHPEEIAQFYIHSEVPTDDSLCRNYYRFTDKEALRSILPGGGCGRIFRRNDIQTTRVSTRTDEGITGSVYQYSRKRSPGIYALRNLAWKLSRWKSRELLTWVEEFAPDAIFLASGDYAFIYDIARELADHVGKPLFVVCVDDYYLHNKNEDSWLGRKVHGAFLKTVRKTMARTTTIFTICDTMARAYEGLFGKSCQVLHTAAEDRELTFRPDASQLSYLGNLGFHRHLQLVEMGRALKGLGREDLPGCIDVYSGEKRPEILSQLTEENGIRFHGMISADGVLEVMARSMAVIHTEAFDRENREKIRFSVSTKIAESLLYGPCLIAYGPEGVASMDYLKETGSAYVITDPMQLETGLKEILSDENLRRQVVAAAQKTAEENHRTEVNSRKLRQWLAEGIQKEKAVT